MLPALVLAFAVDQVCPLFRWNASGAIGMDGAYSVPLGSGRGSLWLFGDTYVGSIAADGRRSVDGFLRNSALAAELTPEQACRAAVPFVGAGGRAAEFLPSRRTWLGGTRFSWPLDGFTAPSGETWLFVSELRNARGGLGFERLSVRLHRWRAGEPRAEPVATLWGREGRDWAFGMAARYEPAEGFVYAFGCRNEDPKKTGLFSSCKLARAPLAGIADRGAWRYHHLEKGWVPDPRAASVLFGDVSGELSVSYNAYLGRYLAVHTRSLSSNVVLRTAPALTGPWSQPLEVFRCRDSALDPALGCYAGKEHPEWAEEGGRVVYLTYASNLDDSVKLRSDKYYWPHLLKVRFE